MIIGNKPHAFIEVNDEIYCNLEAQQTLHDILELYKKMYPSYLRWDKKINYFDQENKVRHEYTDKDKFTIENDFLGYIISKNNKLCLDDNLIKFMFLRYNGLQNCIHAKKRYIENNNTCKEQILLIFFKKELAKLNILICEYQENRCNIESSKEKKIEFVKKICNTIEWSFNNDNSKCTEILQKKILYPKTFGVYKQLVLGSSMSDWLLFRSCNTYFMGSMIGNVNSACDKTVEWNILLNKYAVLSAYYKKAPFIRLLLINKMVMPYRRYQSIKESEKKGKQVGTLHFGPYKFKINYNKTLINSPSYTGRFFFKNFIFYDDSDNNINPPLLRSSTTITFQEWRDLVCYISLPVFRSNAKENENRTMLFFPNYDLHQELLAIQGLPRNYSDYTGKSIEWKWFNEGDMAAKKAITCFCKKFEESDGSGIVPIQYVWYAITFNTTDATNTTDNTGNTKKYIFLICSWEEYMTYYRKSEFLIKKTTPNKLYVYNDVIREHAVNKLKEEYEIELVDYEWFEITFDDCTTKKYLFIRYSGIEYLKDYKNLKKLKYLERWGNYFFYDYEIEPIALVELKKQYSLREPIPLVKLKKQYSLREPTSRWREPTSKWHEPTSKWHEPTSKWHDKYLKYKNKYLELKKHLLLT